MRTLAAIALLSSWLLVACATAEVLAPAHEVAARRVVKVFLVEAASMPDAALSSTMDVAALSTELQRHGQPPLTDAETRAVTQAMIRVARQVILGTTMEQALIRFYAQHFSEDELERIAALYATEPVLLKFSRVSPLLMAELTRVLQDTAAPFFLEALRGALPHRRW